MTSNGNTTKYRVERLEKVVDKTAGKVDMIMTNHLPHINENMIQLNTKISILTAVNVGSIIIAIIIQRII